jgi:hypothetical protein
MAFSKRFNNSNNIKWEHIKAVALKESLNKKIKVKILWKASEKI